MLDRLFSKGIRTSEFWVTLATGIVLLLNTFFDWDLDTESIVAIVGNNVAYILSRGYIKGKIAEPVQPTITIEAVDTAADTLPDVTEVPISG